MLKRRRLVAISKCLGQLLLLVPFFGGTNVAFAGGSWYAGTRDIPASIDLPGSLPPGVAAAVTPSTTKVFDLVISMCKNSQPGGPCEKDYPTDDTVRQRYKDIFDHWADAVCEQSNRALRLGEIRVFRNAQQNALADVVWFAGAEGRPRADFSGFGNFGSRILMYDRNSGTDYLDSASNGTRTGGYVLGHEFAHYVLGIFDEYDEPLGGEDAPAASDLDLQTIMGSDLPNDDNHFALLNHSTPDTYSDAQPTDCSDLPSCLNKTAQGRVYGKSAWEVLVQDEDNPSGNATLQPDRVQYTELQNKKPQSDTGDWDTIVDLPTHRNYCRDHLDPIWMNADLDIQLVIDRSGSMTGTPIANAKTGANNLVDAVELGKTAVGVVAFDAEVEQLCLQESCDGLNESDKIRSINELEDVSDIKSAINTRLVVGENFFDTRLYDGALNALTNIVGHTSTGENSRLVFLLTDGLNETDSPTTAQQVIDQYKKDKVPLSTFAYGNFAAEDVLRNLAEETYGLFRVSPTTVAETQSAFFAVKATLTSFASILRTYAVIQPGTPTDFQFPVDSTLKELSLFVTFLGGQGDVVFTLEEPNGSETGVNFSCTEVGTTTNCSAAVSEDILALYGEGLWSLRVSNETTSEVGLNVEIVGNPLSVIPYDVIVASKSGSTVEYPRPIMLTAIASRGFRITGVGISATISSAREPLASSRPIFFVDDGTGGDWVAGDGIYSAIVDYDANDTYTIEVRIDNAQRNAKFTSVGSLPFPAPPAGNQAQAFAPLPTIEEDFLRTASIQVVTSGIKDEDQNGVPDDDHRNSPPGTLVVPDNSIYAGRIEITDDIDVFTIPAGDYSAVTLRLTELALGMEPELRVERQTEDGVFEEIIPATRIDQLAEGSNYLSLAVPFDDSTSYLHAFVIHASGGTGYYEFSAGPRFTSDAPVFLIDVLPDTDENPINPNSKGKVPVVVFGSKIYDVRKIDPETLAFGTSGAPALHPKGGVFEDLNGDSLEDYLNFYQASASGIELGHTQACLSGEVGGVPFTACDAIRTVPE